VADRSGDDRSKADKMRSVANAKSAAPAEREFAKAWLAEHHEPLRNVKPAVDPYAPFPRSSAPQSDQARRRADAREEAAARREAQARYAREQGHVRGKFFDADAFNDTFAQEFMSGFEEELGRSPFRTGGPLNKAAAETEALRRESARADQMARDFVDSMRNARRDLRQEARDHAQEELHRIRMERDRRAAEAAERSTPRLDRDAAGNPIYRRR
jgi:hypothetical protein